MYFTAICVGLYSHVWETKLNKTLIKQNECAKQSQRGKTFYLINRQNDIKVIVYPVCVAFLYINAKNVGNIMQLLYERRPDRADGSAVLLLVARGSWRTAALRIGALRIPLALSLSNHDLRLFRSLYHSPPSLTLPFRERNPRRVRFKSVCVRARVSL